MLTRKRKMGALVALLLLGMGSCRVEAPRVPGDLLSSFTDTSAGISDGAPLDNDGAGLADAGPATADAGAGCDEGAPCDDGDPCTTGDLCVAGRCRGVLPTDCDDGDSCTEDRCHPVRGCEHAHREVPECQPPLPCATSCDDGNPCTRDGCDQTRGRCANDTITGCRACDEEGPWWLVCDDDDPTTEDGCAASPPLGGTICTHTPLPCGLSADDCDDAKPCTADGVGADCLCRHDPLSGVPCDDGDPATAEDRCENGFCVPGP